jgi:hypothetical protein
MSLNANQKLALEVRMRSLEQRLHQIRMRLHDGVEDGLLTQTRPMAKEASACIEAEIERMLAEIAVIAQEFELQGSVEDAGRRVSAEMSVAWADLHDTLSPKLKRYGAVDPSLGDTLDPHLRNLIDLAQEIGRVADGEPPCDSADPHLRLPIAAARDERPVEQWRGR